jgi:antitoxin HigA-1
LSLENSIGIQQLVLFQSQICHTLCLIHQHFVRVAVSTVPDGRLAIWPYIGLRHVYKDLYFRDVAPPHPGEILRDDILPRLRLSRTALAKRLGIGPRRLANILAERTPVTLDLARRLGLVLGHGPRYWLGLQMQYDIWQADQPVVLAVTPLVSRRGQALTAAARF